MSPPLWLPLLFHRESQWGRSEPHGCRQLSSRHTEEKVHWQVRRHLNIALLSASTFFTNHGYPDAQESYYPSFLYCFCLKKKIITAEFRAHGGERPGRKYFIDLHSYTQKPWLQRPGTGWGLAAAVVTPNALEVEGVCWGSFPGGGARRTCHLKL